MCLLSRLHLAEMWQNDKLALSHVSKHIKGSSKQVMDARSDYVGLPGRNVAVRVMLLLLLTT